MTQSEQIRKEIMVMVTKAENQRQRPYAVVRSISDNLGVPIFKVKKVLDALLKERKMVLTYGDPFSFVELPFNNPARGSRIMKVVVDAKGNPWICDQNVDPSKDLAEQGCWQLQEEGSVQKE